MVQNNYWFFCINFTSGSVRLCEQCAIAELSIREWFSAVITWRLNTSEICYLQSYVRNSSMTGRPL